MTDLSKACLRLPGCTSAQENRDTVFCQMRRAMDMIHYTVKEGILDSSSQSSQSSAAGETCVSTVPSQEDWDAYKTLSAAMRRFEEGLEMTRLTMLGPTYREKLTADLEVITERVQDFTDSAYTSHEHRESILLLCDRVKLELNQLLRIGLSMEKLGEGAGSGENEELDEALKSMTKVLGELRLQLQVSALEQAAELMEDRGEEREIQGSLKNAALSADIHRIKDKSLRFHEHMEHVQEICKLMRHIAPTDALQITARYAEINIQVYGPQVVVAANTLCLHPNSKIAKENLEVFMEMWNGLVNDARTLAKDVARAAKEKPPEKQVYMSLPRRGKHGTTQKPLKPAKLDSEEQAKIAKTGLEMKMITSEMDAETEKWMENASAEENNDIVKRAKNMSSMAFSMYQFTRGEGTLKTTQDLFTQAEYFAEEANRLYKVVRQFSYQVPQGVHKKELLEFLDKVPTYVQQLQFTVKSSTVGKAATFTKVDHVIQETKNLMNVISKVVTTCFVCATKVGHAQSHPGHANLFSKIPFQDQL
ncbi:unnamed protein product [Darwinula stevensoni]|uniref:Alpha-catulin n=1 Tax=Darwinula stevensoni TaxID=69355 RepID=A0A7R8XC03_9CRUS|nr:unnamed protein product [Darwinula stevensoni]CAG0885352.1 unnamed protein product [Darwinula stevensoni]